MPVRSVAQKDIQKLLSSVTREMDDHLENMLRGDHQFVFDRGSTQCQPIDALRWFTEMIPETSAALHIRNIMVNALSDSEGLQGASAVVCVTALLEFLRTPNDVDTVSLKDDIKKISALSRRCESRHLIDISQRLDRDHHSTDISTAAILGCSSNASIQVEQSRVTEVRRVSGYKFPVICPEIFSAASHVQGERLIENPKVLSIDGIIEQMSEIDGVVQSSYDSKTPVIIISRGYSPDVQNTLGTNWYHGHLRVLPVIVPYDAFGANLLNDIAAVTLCDTVSTLKGEIISSRKWCDLKSIEKARVNFDLGSITFQNKSSESSVKSQRKWLRSTRSTSSSEIETNVFNKRLSCLMGEGVVIKLGDDLKSLRGIYADRINSHIRLFRSGSKHGVIRIKDSDSLSLSKKTLNTMKRLETISDSYPTTTLIVGLKTALSCAEHISKIGGIIYSDTRK